MLVFPDFLLQGLNATQDVNFEAQFTSTNQSSVSVNVSGPQLEQLTVSLWIKTNHSGFALEYAVKSGKGFELRVADDLTVIMKGEAR